MSTTAPFVIPTRQGPATISSADYDQLLSRSDITDGERSRIAAAAQILQVFTDQRVLTFRQVIEAVFSDPTAEGTMTLRRALVALVQAKLLVQVGAGPAARYRLATSEERAEDREAGFSLIDVVVTVAIIIALSVGGFLGYQGLVAQAKQGAVDYAASNVWKSVSAYEQDGDSSTSACSAIDEYNRNSEGIKVSLTVPTPVDPSGPGLVYYGEGEANTYTC